MDLQEGVERWVVDISKWKPSPQEFSFAMSFLPQDEHSVITSFIKIEDRKRALLSRLLQYALVHHVLGISFDDIVIKRTFEGKPYLVCDKLNMRFPNFNFNVSHHGDYVGIASEPLCLVGLDIVSNFVPQKERVPDFIQNFSPYFSSFEWNEITSAGSSDEILSVFYRYWCLKEAFVKAIGAGVGYGLSTIEFHHSGWTNILVKVNGKDLTDWRFWLLELDGTHVMCIARGHPRDAAVNYKKTLKQEEFNLEEILLGRHAPGTGFMLRTVEEVLRIFLGK